MKDHRLKKINQSEDFFVQMFTVSNKYFKIQ